MTYYVRNANNFFVVDGAGISQSLPVGNYIVKEDAFKNLYLEQIDEFSSSGKIYGNTMKHVDRIINTFQVRANTTGVLLSGEKGSGKTLMARILAISMNQLDIPCIVINTPWTGDSFNKLIQNIQQPCMILFDEFEKIYKKEDQEKLLTLLDGVYPGKKLFVLTCNDKWRIDEHMRNRPGRIFYSINFAGLDESFIREYCNDVLVNKTHVDRICTISNLFSEFNFDMLKALCEEMNRYNESPEEALVLLNAKPENAEKSRFAVSVFENDKECRTHNTIWEGNPLRDRFEIAYYSINTNKKSAVAAIAVDENDDILGLGGDWKYAYLTTKNIVTIDMVAECFTFIDPLNNVKVVLTKEKKSMLDIYKLF